MENQTCIEVFQLMMFSAKPDYTLLTIFVFFFLYIFGVLFNSIIISVIYTDDKLQIPMYLFLCNLALVDICYTTTTVPKLLYMLLSGDNTMSFIQCFTQMFFYVTVTCTEDVLIFIMAYDRYVAICNPLHYHNILNRINCLLIATGAWISGVLNSLMITVFLSHMSFCDSHTIQQFFCDSIALFNISHGGRVEFYFIICLNILVLGIFPVTFSVTSYVKIFTVIAHIKSVNGRKKAFSTCSSHLAIVILYYITGFSACMLPQSKYSYVLDPVFTALYSVVTPMINPLIYSLRNKDVKIALLKLMGAKKK